MDHMYIKVGTVFIETYERSVESVSREKHFQGIKDLQIIVRVDDDGII